ncbi:MAG: carbohydrate kinase family protein [Bacillota bacterium]
MNYHELQELMSNIGTDNTEDIFELGPKILFITMGGQGSRVITPDNTVTIPAIKPPEIQDTTGAGDAFVGGAVAALLQDRSPAVAARFGSTASSFIIEKTGCQTNIPGQTDFIERYRQNFGQL